MLLFFFSVFIVVLFSGDDLQCNMFRTVNIRSAFQQPEEMEEGEAGSLQMRAAESV